MPQHRGGKKNRKHGRNQKWCDRYRATGQREKNKAKRLIKHLKVHPSDRVALHTLEGLGRREAAPLLSVHRIAHRNERDWLRVIDRLVDQGMQMLKEQLLVLGRQQQR